MKTHMLHRHPFSSRSLCSKRCKIVVNYSPPIYEPNIITIQPSERDIYPPFFEEYIRICDVPSFVIKIDPHECMNTLIIPPYEMQMSIVQDILEMQKMAPSLEPIKPYLMHYMIDQNIEKINELLQSYQLYLMHLENVQDLIVEAIRG